MDHLQYGSPEDRYKAVSVVYTSPGVLHWCGRVAVLVSEGKFEKAEQLVQEFNLEPEVVLCSLLAPVILNCLTWQLVLCKKTIFLNQLVCAGKEEMLEVFLQCLTQMKVLLCLVVLMRDLFL